MCYHCSALKFNVAYICNRICNRSQALKYREDKKINIMYDFMVFYGDFKEKMSLDSFFEELEKVGGVAQDYNVNMYLGTKQIYLSEFENLDLDEMCKVSYKAVDENSICVVFYNYTGEAKAFFDKNNVEHDAKVKHQNMVQKTFNECMCKCF